MAPGLFPGDKATSLGYAHKHVTCYTKFKELAIVLTAPLQDIVDRWADGKGPLAVEMSAVQVCYYCYLLSRVPCYHFGTCLFLVLIPFEITFCNDFI